MENSDKPQQTYQAPIRIKVTLPKPTSGPSSAEHSVGDEAKRKHQASPTALINESGSRDSPLSQVASETQPKIKRLKLTTRGSISSVSQLLSLYI